MKSGCDAGNWEDLVCPHGQLIRIDYLNDYLYQYPFYSLGKVLRCKMSKYYICNYICCIDEKDNSWINETIKKQRKQTIRPISWLVMPWPNCVVASRSAAMVLTMKHRKILKLCWNDFDSCHFKERKWNQMWKHIHISYMYIYIK